MTCSTHLLVPEAGCRDCIRSALAAYEDAARRLAEASQGMSEEELDDLIAEFLTVKGQRVTEAVAERLGIERPQPDTEG